MPAAPTLALRHPTASSGVRPVGIAVALSAMVLATGCPPDLSRWSVVPVGQDGGVDPRVDAGQGMPNPIQLGAPCPNPHFVVASVDGTSATARLWRFDPSGNRCRESDLIAVQRAFGSGIYTVQWHPDTGTLLGLRGALLALDAEGFPRWRYQPADGSSQFEPMHLAVFGSGGASRIGVAYGRSSGTFEYLMLLNAQGAPASAQITASTFARSIAPHPDGSARVVVGSGSGADLGIYTPTDATTRLSGDGDPLWGTSAAPLSDTYGSRYHLAADPTSRRLVITHERGVAHWTVGSAPPRTAYACGSTCSGFVAAAPDPNDPSGAFAVCTMPSGGDRHVVRVRADGCSIVIDGTSTGTRTITDIALVRAAL